jgi:hypothetical protein
MSQVGPVAIVGSLVRELAVDASRDVLVAQA